MRLSIELDREDDGRWIADVLELPGSSFNLAFAVKDEQLAGI
ncbi:MAG: hypothetical protein NTY38_26900 [Acidobacteria bacterium]|nr:hypothetical protein [Acidobacteriota bacterium]